MPSSIRKTFSAVTGVVAAMALLLSGGVGFAAGTRAGQAKADSPSTRCPLGIPGAKLAVHETPQGVKLTLTTSADRVEPLRRRVAGLTSQIRARYAAAAHLAMMNHAMMGPMLGGMTNHMMWNMMAQQDWGQVRMGSEGHGNMMMGKGRNNMMGGDRMHAMAGGHHGMQAWDHPGGMGKRMAGWGAPWTRLDTRDIAGGVEIRLSQAQPDERQQLQRVVEQRSERLASAAACRLPSLLKPVTTSAPKTSTGGR